MMIRARAALLALLLLWAACPGTAAHSPNPDMDASAGDASDRDASGSMEPCLIGSAGPRCSPCPAGSFCPGGTTPMALCVTNTFDHDQDPKTPCVAASSCPAGTYVAAPYSRVTDQRCAACPSGSFSAEINSRSCSDFRKCADDEFIREPGSATEDQVCQRTRVCQGDEYERLAPTSQRDRECSARTICTPGQYVSAQPTATTDRSCTDCATGFFSVSDNASECLPWRTCDTHEIESRAPSRTLDRECACQTSSEDDAGPATSTCTDP